MSKEERELSVLIVEDEPHLRDALRLILEDRGFTVATAATGGAGVELARRGGFGLVITDLRLPDMTGLDVMRAVRELNPRTSIILTTSYGSPEIFAEARSLGAAAILDKPFSPSQLLNMIDATLDGRGPNALSDHVST
jgi:DNA-binding response OmpR family regulator